MRPATGRRNRSHYKQELQQFRRGQAQTSRAFNNQQFQEPSWRITWSLAEERLPYVAELVEVRPKKSGWRGAIERAIGGHRLRLLVPEQLMQRALAWVNDRDNRLHVRLREARLSVTSVQWFEDSYVPRLSLNSTLVRMPRRACSRVWTVIASTRPRRCAVRHLA